MPQVSNDCLKRKQAFRAIGVACMLFCSCIALGDNLHKSDTLSKNVHPPDSTQSGSFDIKVLWSVAKFRPATANLPLQFNTELNVNLYLGWQWVGSQSSHRKQKRIDSFGVGAFGGIGTTPVNPTTTNHRTTLEYSGAVASYGLALLAGVERFTFGFAAGTDYLMSEDRPIWIYDGKLWYGITLGIKLN